MSKEQVLIKHIQDYLDSGMYQYEACYLNKEDLQLIIEALEQKNAIRLKIMSREDLYDALDIIDDALDIIDRCIYQDKETKHEN